MDVISVPRNTMRAVLAVRMAIILLMSILILIIVIISMLIIVMCAYIYIYTHIHTCISFLGRGRLEDADADVVPLVVDHELLPVVDLRAHVDLPARQVALDTQLGTSNATQAQELYHFKA